MHFSQQQYECREIWCQVTSADDVPGLSHPGHCAQEFPEDEALGLPGPTGTKEALLPLTTLQGQRGDCAALPGATVLMGPPLGWAALVRADGLVVVMKLFAGELV